MACVVPRTAGTPNLRFEDRFQYELERTLCLPDFAYDPLFRSFDPIFVHDMFSKM
jgi:hypothetical protein